jgi:nucleoside-diphosphate-sugar epimerase
MQMRVFVTGATGFVGSAVVQELIQAGHTVIGLARSEAGAKSLRAAGAEVHQGDVQDPESLRRGAAGADGVIHTAFIHDFTRYRESCEIDRRAIEAVGSELVGSDRPMIVTSGTGLLSPGRLGTEEMLHSSGPEAIPRVASEEAAVAVAARGVRASIVRLPPSVHGDGDHGFVPLLIGLAREKRVSAYVGEGRNRWPAVHRLDAAKLYRLVLGKGRGGARYHGVAEEGIPFKDIAGVIGRQLRMPVVSKSSDEAESHFGWFAHFAALDAPASSEWTEKQLGWKPTQIGLLADLEQGRYFKG